ncbi:MAG TPA: TetR-like C-terminal domain-containing protein [Streptosporangiaceae bacterium]|nr:TetR-like C-terminal domain-containing protein [Streptosporangiaceae bacterium]
MPAKQMTRARQRNPRGEGERAFQQLIERVAAAIGTDRDDPRAFFTAQLIWQQLHGIVSLRISRSKFPWPPLEPTVRAAVAGLLATTQDHS